MFIDTSNCSFNSTPLYLTSIAGLDLHNGVTGYNSIYGASRLYFTIYVLSTVGWGSNQLLNYSADNQWNVNWIGFSY
jgi:hypothetical protein